jgi:hypothetical protein
LVVPAGVEIGRDKRVQHDSMKSNQGTVSQCFRINPQSHLNRTNNT